MINILLTCVGRRSYLVDFFKIAVGASSRVISGNSDELTSGMVTADKSYIFPRVDSVDYISKVLQVCKKEEISLVVPLFDIDLPCLAKARTDFSAAGIQLVVSDPWVVDVANDKWETYQFLSKKKIPSPRTYISLNDVLKAVHENELNFPLIIKPRWGMGSLSVYRADDENELCFFYHYAQRQIKKNYISMLCRDEIAESVLIQECISGNEYGLDVFNDLDGCHIQTIVKQKLAMRSGETDIARTVADSRLELLGDELAGVLKHRGNMDVDVLEDQNGKLFVLEMNARFGGGYPFSHLAGADFPRALVQMAQGMTPKKSRIQNHCIGLKSIGLIKAT